MDPNLSAIIDEDLNELISRANNHITTFGLSGNYASDLRIIKRIIDRIKKRKKSVLYKLALLKLNNE